MEIKVEFKGWITKSSLNKASVINLNNKFQIMGRNQKKVLEIENIDNKDNKITLIYSKLNLKDECFLS